MKGNRRFGFIGVCVASMMLSFVMGCSTKPSRDLIVPENKQTANEVWNGEIDEGWYDKEQSKFYLETAQELAGLSNLVNTGYTNFDGKEIYLSSDIYLNDISNYSIWEYKEPNNNWTPIGYDYNSKNVFEGKLNGDGHSIKGMYVSDKTAGNKKNLSAGLFGGVRINNIDMSASISNVSLRQSKIVINNIERKYDHAGSIVGFILGGGTFAKFNGVMNVLSDCDITCVNYNCLYVGGIAGLAGANFFNCGYNGHIVVAQEEKTTAKFGGISAGGAVPSYVINCYTTTDFTGQNINFNNAGAVSYQGYPFYCYYRKGEDVNSTVAAFGNARREETDSNTLSCGNGKFEKYNSKVIMLDYNLKWNGKSAIYGDNRVLVDYTEFDSLTAALNFFSFENAFSHNKKHDELLVRWKVAKGDNGGYPVLDYGE